MAKKAKLGKLSMKKASMMGRTFWIVSKVTPEGETIVYDFYNNPNEAQKRYKDLAKKG